MKLKQKIQKINETKSWFFEKINKTDRLLARLTKKRREKIWISSIRDETEDTITDTSEIQKIIQDYYEHLYTHKLENLEEMNKFLERYNPPSLNQEDLDTLSRPITSSSRIEIIMKNYQQKNVQVWPDAVAQACNPGTWEAEAGGSPGQEIEIILANIMKPHLY